MQDLDRVKGTSKKRVGNRGDRKLKENSVMETRPEMFEELLKL